MTSFKYVRRLQVIFNLHKAWRRWSHLSIILGREGANPKISGCFYIAVVKDILIFGLEMWLVTPKMGRILGFFHHKVARRLSG